MNVNRVGCMVLAFLTFAPILSAQAAVPLLINYQGIVKDAMGAPVNADGYFKFAIVNQLGTTAHWVNNGLVLDGSEPPNAVITPVTDGRFLVKLGDNTNLTNMAALTESVFENTPAFLRVWFSLSETGPYELFSPDTQIVSTGFAFKAGSADRAIIADEVTNFDTTQVQARVSNSCTGGDTISAINEDGSVVCDVDDSEVYTAGSGISISVGIISIADGGVGNVQISDVAWGKLINVPANIADGDDVGILNELDPTVLASVKDGISWSELTGIPTDIADGDNVGIFNELDPTVLASVKDGISWSELTGIPAGFADGVDDMIGPEVDPTVLASVKDGVSWTELSAIPAGFADGVDNGIAFEVDPTVLASVKDGISWTEISAVPAGFADGVDNDTDTNTTYTAGAGLSLNGTVFNNTAGADMTNMPPSTNFNIGDLGIKQVASVTVDIPMSGIVIVTHTGTVLFLGDNATLTIGIGDTSTAMDTFLSHIGHLDGTSVDRIRLPYTVQHIFNVSAGIQTFYGLAAKTFDGADATLQPQSITAIFLPQRI